MSDLELEASHVGRPAELAPGLFGRLGAVLSGRSPTLVATVLFFLALPELYLLPTGTSDVAATTILAGVLLPGVLLHAWRGSGRRLLSIGLVRVLLGLLGIRLLAVAWSPTPESGLQPIVLLGQFILMLVLMSESTQLSPRLLNRLQLVYWPWVVLEIVLVVLFRALPGLEDGFLGSVGPYVAGHNTIAGLFGPAPNNVLDPTKSGGVFVNANTAAMFLGVSGLMAVAVAAVTRSRWVRIVGIAALAVIPATGSKAATILAVVLPAAAYVGYRSLRLARPGVRRAVIGSLVGCAVLVVTLAATLNVAAARSLRAAFIERTVIWAFGAQEFRHHPVLGLGYGGWDAGFLTYGASHGLSRVFPPHNLLLAAWSVTGLAGVLLTAAFFVLALRLFLTRISTALRLGHGDESAHRATFAVCGAAAVGWLLIEGLGNNTDVFGEIHLIPIVALAIGYVVRQPAEEAEKEAEYGNDKRGNDKRGYDGRSQRWDRQTPVVPAVGDVHNQPGPGVAVLPSGLHQQGSGTDGRSPEARPQHG